MPSKYRIRNYQENSFYHVYNHGLGKGNIFLDNEDYQKFLDYLEIYLASSEYLAGKYPKLPTRLKKKTLNQDLELIAYLLVQDHFHLIIKQKSKSGTSKLLKQLLNAYTYYFNNKYEGSGPLFQGKFKSVLIKDPSLLPLITHHLHLHPGLLWLTDDIKKYPWSSFHDYLQSKSTIVSKDYVLNTFSSLKDYEKFIQNENSLRQQIDEIKPLLIDK